MKGTVRRITGYFLVSVVSLLVSGCSTNMFAKGVGGAAAGAAGTSLVGAMTDLIVDGRVDTYRLTRNAVSGAIAGGAAGAAVGHEQDKKEAQAKQAAAASAAKPDKELVKEIGRDNVEGLNALLYYRHEEAYKKSLKSVKSKKRRYQAAGYALQALTRLSLFAKRITFFGLIAGRMLRV